VLPSLPAIVTVVALVAVTVNVDELPAEIEAGLAVIVTVGGAVEPLKLVPLHPVNSNGSKRTGVIETRNRRTDLPTRAFAKVFLLLTPRGEHASPVSSANTRTGHTWP
jgi:hypothetical protein